MNGISQTIVDRADQIASLSARGENLIAACAVLSAQETQALDDAVGYTCLSTCGPPVEKRKANWFCFKGRLAREFLSLDLSASCDVELMRDRLEKLFNGSGAGSS